MSQFETNQKRKRGGQPGNQNAKKKIDPEQAATEVYLREMNEVLDKFNAHLKAVKP